MLLEAPPPVHSGALSARSNSGSRTRSEGNGGGDHPTRRSKVTGVLFSIASHVLSLRGTIAILCLFGIAAAGISSMVLGEVSCDSALDDTRSQNSESLTRCWGTSRDTLTSVVKEMFFLSATSTESGVRQFLLSSILEAKRTETYLGGVRGEDDKVTNPLEFVNSTLPAMWLQMDTPFAVGSDSLYGVGFSQVLFNMTTFIPAVSGASIVYREQKLMHVLVNQEYPANIFLGEAEKYTGALIASTTKSLQNEGSKTLEYAARVMGPGQTKWAGLDSFSADFLGAIIVTAIEDRAPPGKRVDALTSYVYVNLRNINILLNQMANRTLQATGADTRIFTLIRTAWLADAMAAADSFEEDQIVSQRTEGFLTGVSHGIGINYVNGMDQFYGVPATMLPRGMPATEADDPVIRGVARAVGARPGGYAGIQDEDETTVVLNITRPVNNATDFLPANPIDATFKTLSADGADLTEQHFVSVRRVDDGMGIDWWLVLSLNAQHVMENVTISQGVVEDDLYQADVRVSDSVDHDRLNTRLVVVGVAVVILLFCFVTTHIVLRPISAIQCEMAKVARLNFKTVKDNVVASSPMMEVRAMQRDFLKMACNLLEYRAYVPDAVIGGDSGGSGIFSSSKRVVAPPSGEVCIMFTDIQGSTKLWKRSANDMNIALELHNDLIRGVYETHGGYEVKTIGDSFMIAFSDPVAALNTAVEIQQVFKATKWPERLGLPAAGLVVRIGIHLGSTIAEDNPITGRVDYRGSTVNLAARLEGKAKGGTICITRAVLGVAEAHRGGIAALPHQPAHFSFGKHELRGLGGGHELYLVAPGALANRFYDSRSDCREASAPTIGIPIPQNDDQSERSSQVSSHGARLASTGFILGMKKTELFLDKSVGTVAVSSLPMHAGSAFDDFNMVVRSAVETAVSLDGQVISVAAGCIVIAWNASKKCKQHVTSALRFAESQEHRTTSMCIGIATGTIYHGNVGTAKHRYTTSLGPPLRMAEAAAEYAEESLFYAIYADAAPEGKSLSRHSAEHVASCLFLCDVWFSQRLSLKVDVYQLDCAVLASLQQSWDDLGGAAQRVSTKKGGEKEADIAGKSVELFKEALACATRGEVASKRDQIETLAGRSRLAAHHHRMLGEACPEDLLCGYLTHVRLLRSPALPTIRGAPAADGDRGRSAGVASSSVPSQAPAPPPRFGWDDCYVGSAM